MARCTPTAAMVCESALWRSRKGTFQRSESLRASLLVSDFDSTDSVTFARHGELLVIAGNDGTVSLWDVERDQSAGTVWTGTGAGNSGLPWYDETTDSAWVATSGNLIKIQTGDSRRHACSAGVS
jgi:WD40 repeat protein